MYTYVKSYRAIRKGGEIKWKIGESSGALKEREYPNVHYKLKRGSNSLIIRENKFKV